MARPAAPDRSLIRLATSLSVATAVSLTVAKAVVWVLSGSVALMASMADSALDLAAATGTFFAVRYAAVPPDAEHRFGHGKAEAFASLLQAGLVFASAALVGEEAIQRLLKPQPVTHVALGLGVMGLSIVLTGLLIGVQNKALARDDSVAVEADRTHYLLDLASNLIALSAIAATAVLHAPLVDSVSGVLIVAVLLRGAVSVFRRAANQLMDRELPDAARAEIVRLITADPAILDVHQLRTRAAGPVTYIQMHADLDPDLSLEAAHKVVVAAERRVLSVYPAADILIHADPRGRAEPHGGAFAET